MAKGDVKYMSEINNFIKDFEKQERIYRLKAASHLRAVIKKKANAIKKTGNLALGVYSKNNKEASFIGIHAPAYHAYLVEFGKTNRDGSRSKPNPIVYGTFAEEAQVVESIMSQQIT